MGLGYHVDGKPALRKRDSSATKKRILDAAKKEFSNKGLSGARMDEIALKSKANKRMIYHYFGNKEALFMKTLEDAYVDIRSAEQGLNLIELDPEDALITLVKFTWDYYLKNPEFITLVNSENLHKGKHLKKSKIIEDISNKFVSMVGAILDKGVESGQFRAGIDPVQLNITIAAIGYYYLTNKHTGAIVYQRELDSKDAYDERLNFNIETILRLVKTY